MYFLLLSKMWNRLLVSRKRAIGIYHHYSIPNFHSALQKRYYFEVAGVLCVFSRKKCVHEKNKSALYCAVQRQNVVHKNLPPPLSVWVYFQHLTSTHMDIPPPHTSLAMANLM